MEKIEELSQKYIFDRLECLKWDLNYYKHRNTYYTREVEESEDKITDILEEIRDLESLRELPRKKQYAPIGFGEGDHPDFLHNKEH